MKQPLKLPRIATLIIFLILGTNYCISQTESQKIKIESSAAGYKSSNLNIKNNSDMEVNFGISGNSDNYTFSYKLNEEAAVNLTTPSKKDNNTISFLIPRKDFNRLNINSITFTINTKTPAKEYTVILPISSASLSQGNILDDAIALEEANGTDIQLLIDILSFHSGRDLTYSELQTLIEKNPYLNSLIQVKTGDPVKTYSIASVDNTVKGISRLSNGNVIGAHNGGGVAGLDVTKYANAMAEIMIDHAKEELTIAFFNRFKNFITEHEEFRILFPKTSDKLENLLAYKYPEMIKALRTVFLEDIRMIAYHIDDVLALPKYKELTIKYPEVTIAIRSLRLVHQLETGGLNASGVLSTLAGFSEWNTSDSNKFKNVGAALKTANLINQSISFRDTNSEIKWQEPKQIAKLFEDELLFKIYMGLLYEKTHSMTGNDAVNFIKKDGTTISLTAILENKSTEIFLFQNKIQEFTDLVSIVQKTVKDLDESKTKTNEQRYTYISNSIDVVEYAFSLYGSFDSSFEVSDEYISILRIANDIYKNVYEEQYNAAISNTVDLFSKIITLKNDKYRISTNELKEIEELTKEKDLVKTAKKLNKNSFDVVSTDIATLAAAVSANSELSQKIADFSKLNNADKKNSKTLEDFLELVQKIKPYALFMANMVEAKDEKEVKAALDAVILPVGSSSIKKNSDLNFNIQSYLGARWSFTDPKNAAVQSTWNDRFAISAPIGFSVSHGFDNNWGAISLFLPILDLGAIVDYKLKYENEGTQDEKLESKDYTIKLGQIFSPGAYIVYGLGANIPVSLGFGGQYGPGLSKIDENNSTTVSNPYWKWNVFLSVDIPLFNLSNKAKVK
ncbi:hypothetical protein Flavo103_36780 [Flavobacterium collinsii]|uniref:hypothetical protein n=1 Tax=Flavobacterium collinsii TaxID=1114861 RepID=UPI0022CB239B|nr:hypothetical protein [Flavobacterium collinsii]GIQ60542.1 hypothetical protein Flavo103_36780 [Flavobacterium collinsii]